MDGSEFSAGWLGLVRAGREAERLRVLERGAFWRHIFPYVFQIFKFFGIFLVWKNMENIEKSVQNACPRPEKRASGSSRQALGSGLLFSGGGLRI